MGTSIIDAIVYLIKLPFKFAAVGIDLIRLVPWWVHYVLSPVYLVVILLLVFK